MPTPQSLASSRFASGFCALNARTTTTPTRVRSCGPIFGLPRKLELITEFEFRADEGRFGDGAAGLKWAPVRGPWSSGLEALALLPVSRSTVEVVSSPSFSPPFVERTSVFTSTREAFTTRARTRPSRAGERAPAVSFKLVGRSSRPGGAREAQPEQARSRPVARWFLSLVASVWLLGAQLLTEAR